ncbi:unnamed protein product [Polarella glacialis]|uniref:Uncharacterized protein n=1 Tax=Polarella glacialis TaxID=89957 RepID=A0A813D3C3_POLGL|nr:unnamed protein product [Polarella glacialis]
MPRPFFVNPTLSCCGGDTFVYVPFVGYLRSEPVVWGGLAVVLLLLPALAWFVRAVVSTVRAPPKGTLARWSLLAAPAVLAVLLGQVVHEDTAIWQLSGQASHLFGQASYLFGQLCDGMDPNYVMNMAFAQTQAFKSINENARYIHKAGEIRDMFTQQEMSNVTALVHELSKHWQHRPNLAGPLPFFTLGAASYLDHVLEMYAPNAIRVNTRLMARLPWFYERLRAALEQELGEKAEFHSPYPEDWPEGRALPGFHLFLSNSVYEMPVARVHYDGQYKSLPFPEGCEFEQTISFTLPVDLPRAPEGAAQPGLYTFHIPEPARADLVEGETVKRFEGEYQDEYREVQRGSFHRVHHPYKVGTMVIHAGYMVHQISPSRWASGNDARITLQGHGVYHPPSKTWLLYW